jgi:hypothetical protein
MKLFKVTALSNMSTVLISTKQPPVYSPETKSLTFSKVNPPQFSVTSASDDMGGAVVVYTNAMTGKTSLFGCSFAMDDKTRK